MKVNGESRMPSCTWDKFVREYGYRGIRMRGRMASHILPFSPNCFHQASENCLINIDQELIQCFVLFLNQSSSAAHMYSNHQTTYQGRCYVTTTK